RCICYSYCGEPPALHSFPTRRSSDLGRPTCRNHRGRTPMNAGATLRMLDRADREVMQLSRADIGAVYEFMHKFRRNPQNPGLQRSEEHTSELQSRENLVCRLLLEKKK